MMAIVVEGLLRHEFGAAAETAREGTAVFFTAPAGEQIRVTVELASP